MSVEPRRVVLGVEGQQAAMAGSVALLSTVEDVERFAQRRGSLIAECRHIAVAAHRFVVEKDRLQDRFIRCLALAHADSHLPFLDAKTHAEGAPQSDPERLGGIPVLQSEELELEDVGSAAASEREPALDGESGSGATAAAVRFLSAAKDADARPEGHPGHPAPMRGRSPTRRVRTAGRRRIRGRSDLGFRETGGRSRCTESARSGGPRTMPIQGSGSLSRAAPRNEVRRDDVVVG